LILSKRRELLEAIEAMNLASLSIGEPTYSSFDNKKTPDLLDFGIIKGIAKNYCRTKFCLKLSSDHSPVIFIINSKIMTKNKPCTLCNVKTDWLYFQKLLKTTLDNSIPLKTEDDITNAIERFNQTVIVISNFNQQVIWSATPTSSESISNTHRQSKKK